MSENAEQAVQEKELLKQALLLLRDDHFQRLPRREFRARVIDLLVQAGWWPLPKWQLERLDPIDRMIVERHMGPDLKPSTFDVLAAELGVARERVRQRETRAVRTLRRMWAYKDPSEYASIHDVPLEQAGLAPRLVRLLEGAEIVTVGDLLAQRSDAELLKIKGFGQLALKEVDQFLITKGLKREAR